MPSDIQKTLKKARETERKARLFAQYELTRRGYRRVFLLSKKGYESTGIVDLVAVKKHRDETEIVLIQVKGGKRRVSESEKKRLRAACKNVRVRCATVEYIPGSWAKMAFV